jgi:autotransporter-associated beta strand protein
MRPTLPTFFRRHLPFFLGGFLVAHISPTQAQPRPAPLADAPLTRRLHGEEALQVLGNRVRDVARFHRMEEGTLRRVFQRDRSLWVDPHGRLFYVCELGVPPQPGPVGESTNTPPLNPPYGLTQTFKLHSRPGASRVIYLDFDGHDASTTIWASGTGNLPIARAYDTDGSPYIFGNTERSAIQFIWARVAEDYLQYDIDVTTEDPGVAALKNTGTGRYGVRVVIGGDSADWYGSAGGVAYLNSFDDNEDLPCWVFPKSLADNEKNIAEACSHEAGHTLSLLHDGQTPGVEYYTGQGNWAPIMGVGYNRPIVQWSQGEYNQANNTEDDLARMLSFGAIYRPDDYGDDTASARPLSGVRPFIWGIIGHRTDVDFFSFEAGNGRTTITATPAPRGPNLHIQLSLYDGNGSLIISSNVADNATTGVLPVTISLILPVGNYYVSVEGIGSGSPLSTGYSDYASLGQYTLLVTMPGDGTWAAATGGTYSWLDPANWNSGTFPMGWSGIARITNDISGDQTITIDAPVTIGHLLLGDADASHTFTIGTSGAGVLQFGTTNGSAGIAKFSGLNDTIIAPLQLKTNLSVTNTTTADLIISGNVDGPYSLTKYGSGRVVLGGVSTFSQLIIAESTLSLGSSPQIAAGSITIATNALLDVSEYLVFPGGWPLATSTTLAGNGAVTGDVVTAASSRLSPGSAILPGTLSFRNQLALTDGTELNFHLGSVTNVGGSLNDLIAVGGNLVLTGQIAVSLDFGGVLPDTNGSYTLLTYSGTLTGGAANLTAANTGRRFTYAFDDSVTGEIRVHVSGAPESLTWAGDGTANEWNVSAATNWLRSGIPDAFFQGDPVLFDSTGSTSPGISLSGALSPASLTVSNTASYTFSGIGRISGGTTITKQGSGALTLATSNDFGGVTLVQDGTLSIGDAAALGLTNSGTIITNTGQLNLNSSTVGFERLIISGSGPAGDGALINTGSAQTNALRLVTLSGDAAIGGSARWDIRGVPASNITASLTGNGYALTKTGANQIWFANLGSIALGNITVNQGTLGFEGANTMANTSLPLTVGPGAALAFRNAFDSDFGKPLVLNSCTVQNDSGHNNLVGGATLSGSVTTSIGEAATLDLRGAASGSGGIDKTGVGILRLAGANSFSGNITVTAGTLMAGNNAALGSAVGTTTIASGARLDLAAFSLGSEQIFATGSGINGRGAIVSSLPTSQQNALRFVTLTGNTTFGGSGRWDLRANPTGSLLGAFNLTKVGGNEVWLVDLDTTQLKTITVDEGTVGFQGTTTMGDAASTMTVNSGGSFGIAATGSNILSKIVTLNTGRLFSSSGSNTLAGNMSLSGSNHVDIASGTTLVLGGNLTGSGFFNKVSAGTLVLAGNNTSSGLSRISAGTLQIGAGGISGSYASTLSNSAAIVFDRTADLTHAAAITGTGTLTKQNVNTLTLSGANIYSGLTTISAGTLRVGNATALGLTTAGTTVTGGATLDVNGFNLGAEVVTAIGDGVGGTGAVINTGASQNNSLRFLTLAGNTSLGGSARWDLRAVSGVGALSSGGQPYSLTKTGPNTIALNNVTVDAALGNVAVQQGELSVEQGTTSLGNPATSATISSGATLSLYSLTNALNKLVILESGGKLSHSGPVSGGISSTVSGPITLSGGDAYLDNASALYALQINNSVNGTGNLNKTGAGLVQLNATNNHTGATVVSAGTLKLGAAATLNTTPAISIASGAGFDVSSLGGGFVLGGAQSLGGNGTVIGNVIAGGTVSPGASVGRLTISGNATLAGYTLMEVAKSGTALTNDVLSVGGTLICGGALAVVRTGDPLAVNDSFQLFSAGALTGSFTSVSLPALNSGLTWNVSTVNSDGWLRVVSNTPPVIGSVSLNGGGIVITGSGGASGAIYFVLATTDVAQPLAEWLPVATNAFDAGGNFFFTNPIAPANPQQFFRLHVP